ncbi:DNA polymerase phi-domain-containing protein [Xylariales sp. PMI_506]|nr:DNA polymerase phi-domain-containing protein [Xylariales sp. PMI_506]
MGSKRKRGGKGSSGDQQPSRKKAKGGDVPVAQTTSQLELDKSPFTEKVAGEDRKREAKIYELLGSYDSAEHIAAADALVTGLLRSEEVVLERHLEKRLFRGLASSRNASRVGFSLVLTEILAQLFGPKNLAETKYSGLSFEKVLGILVEKTQPSGNLPGQEERDYYFGQLFGLQCFVEAKILFGSDDHSRWPSIMELLLKLANQKAWLRSQCAWVIVETLPQMGQEKASETLNKLVEIGLGKTAEGVGIWLKAASCYPQLKMPSKPWTNPLAPKSIPELANVLKENVKQDTGNTESLTTTNPGNWTAQLHFVWDLILAHFIGQAKSGKADNVEQFKVFWNTVIDDGLYSKNATEGQKFRGFMIFQKFIQAFTAVNANMLIGELFSRNLMKCMVNQAAKEDRYVHRAAVKSLKVVAAVVESEPTFSLPVLIELLGKHGSYDFDQRTNTKTVEKILQSSKPEDFDSILKLLRSPVVSVKVSEVTEIEKLRRVYIDYIFKLCSQDNQPSKEDAQETSVQKSSVVEAAIKEIASCAYSKADTSFSPPLSDKTREYCRSRLESALAKLTKRREDYRYLCNAVQSIDPTAITMSAEIEAERKAALKALRKLIKSSSKSDDESDLSLGLALLFSVTILQLYNGDADALNTLADLKQCAEKMKEADSAASALLVEILLSLVSRPSPMMRQVTQQVFEAFTAQFSADALERLTDPLLAEENIKGQQTLFEVADEDDEMIDAEDGEDDSDVEDLDDISEIGSDVEFVTLNGATAAEEEDEESNDDEDDDADAQELADLDDALAQVLKSHRLDKDKEAESSDSDSDMTDSEMMALDEKLVEVFKQRAKKSNKKKENKDAKETIVIFKHRVLDFLDIYVKKEARKPLAFGLLAPLLELIRSTPAKDLVNKGTKIIADFAEAFKKAKSSADPAADEAASRLELLRQIHQEAARGHSAAFVQAVSKSSLLVASSLVAVDKDQYLQEVGQVYLATSTEWGLGRVKIQPSFFSDWLNWLQAHASKKA